MHATTNALTRTNLVRPPASGATPGPGRELVARATDPATGRVDTARLAGWVADAARGSPAKASAAHAAIEAQLGVGDRSRFNADVGRAFRRDSDAGVTYSATGAALAPGAAGGRILRDNPILEIRWETTISPVTQKSGFSAPLEKLLRNGGIVIDLPVNGRPAGGTTVNTPASRTANGHAARDAIAARIRGSGEYTHVGTEATENTRRATSLGGRQVDVVADQKGPRREMNKKVEVESKLGRASASVDTKLQVAKDVERLAANVSVRRVGTVLEGVGKVAKPIGIAVDAVQVGRAYRADGNRVGDQTQRAIGGVAGGAAGALGGAKIGAALGSFGGPVGTVVGGVAGAAVGGIVGSGAGEKAVGWVKSWF
jgi:hypothetical protein